MWRTTNHHTSPGDHPVVYFDRDTLVHVHQRRRTHGGYLPWRIASDQHGNDRIGGQERTSQAVSEKSEGDVPEAHLHTGQTGS